MRVNLVPFKNLTKYDLIRELIKNKFAIYKSNSKTWEFVAISENKYNILCVLVRKGGVDFKIFDKSEKSSICISDNCVSITGGVIYRNYYLNSDVHLIMKTVRIINLFSRNVKSGKIFISDGESNKSYANYEFVKKEMIKRYKKKKYEEAERRYEAGNNAIAFQYGWVD